MKTDEKIELLKKALEIFYDERDIDRQCICTIVYDAANLLNINTNYFATLDVIPELQKYKPKNTFDAMFWYKPGKRMKRRYDIIVKTIKDLEQYEDTI